MARQKKKVVKKSGVSKGIVRQSNAVRSDVFWGVLWLMIGLLSFVAICDFDLAQSRQVQTDPEQNLVGVVGAEFAFWTFHFLGVAVWLFPAYLVWIGIQSLLRKSSSGRGALLSVVLLSLLSAAGLGAMLEADRIFEMQSGLFQRQLSAGVGGKLGDFIAIKLLKPVVGPFGTYTLLMVGLSVAPLSLSGNLLGKQLSRAPAGIKAIWQKCIAALLAWSRANAAKKAAAKEAREARKLSRRAEKKAMEESEAMEAHIEDGEEPPSLLRRPDGPPPGLRPANGTTASSLAAKPIKEVPVEEVKKPVPAKPKLDPGAIKIVSGVQTEKAVDPIPEQRGDYKFPPIKLLSEAPVASNASPEDHAQTMEALVRTLEEFGVKVIPGEIHTGPVITRYEVKPAPGVRVEKIVNLDKNIALGLRALSVRILAPVPGKGTVGIEVPNRISQPVCMRDIVESKAWADARAEIPIVLGKDVTGTPMVTDLTKMPHVLIAGSTGSGKTVCINAIIASLLYHSGPEDIRFMMVDPKVVEMQVYNALPHMLIPVVTEPKKVPGALKWLLAEMERRYQIFAKENVRNIAGFNAKLAKTKEEKEKAAAMDAEMTAEERAAVSQIEVPRDDDAFEIPRKKLPYIVCIIDELADLMMVAPADIETGIARLAQLARAAGIHLILATQRPSVNVITGVIKANLPSRISFKVASKVDSRTILDGGGAEALIGKGDMLFIPPGTSNLVRAQGAFVSDDEINGIVEYLKENNDPPNFAEEVQNQINSSAEEGGGSGSAAGDSGSEEDALLAQAIDVLRSTKRASTSMLQRRLRIGYNRAARLMEELEERGIVGPENGSSPREILVDLDVM